MQGAPGRREATILFSDLLGFPALAEQCGVEEAFVHTTTCLRRLDGVAREYRGAIDKYLGDALMVVFDEPEGAEASALLACRAAIAMHRAVEDFNRAFRLDPPLSVHTGIQTGSVLFGETTGHVVREFHVLGDAVNVAARLKERARGGEIYLGEAAAERLGTEFELLPLSRLALKGKQESIATFSVVAPPRAPRVFADLAPDHEEAIGIGDTLRSLEGYLDAVDRGEPFRACVVAGPNGAGKSRALAEARRRRLDALWLEIHPEVSPRLEDHARGWAERVGAGERLGAESPSDAVAWAAWVVERAAQAPAVVVVDDLELADAEVLTFLERLVAAEPDAPIGVLVVTSDPATVPFPAETLTLAPLDEAASRALLERTARAEGHAALLDAAGAWLPGLLAQAGGRPARLREAARAVPLVAARQAAGLPWRRDQQARETERRRAVVLFADITGFTSLTERLPATEAFAAVQGCLSVLDETAREFGGTVEKHLGDCVLAMFGVPQAIEDAPRAAINAAIEMRRRVARYDATLPEDISIGVHIGVETGLGISGDISGAVLRESAVMGDSMAAASALCDAAPKGEIWIGPETHRETQDRFALSRAETVSLPGGMPLEAFQVRSDRGALHRRSIGSGQDAWFEALVGRDAERAVLESRLRACAGGEGSVINLVAEAGLGKSRLVAEFRTLAERAGVRVWMGRSLSNGGRLAYHPFADLLRDWAAIEDDLDDAEVPAGFRAAVDALVGADAEDVFPHLARLMGFAADRDARRRFADVEGESLLRLVVGAVRRWVEAEASAGPIALVFEDLHWADASSGELLLEVVSAVADLPLMILAAQRPAHAGPSVDFLEACAAQRDFPQTRLDLRPLSDADVKRLIDHTFAGPGFSHALRERITDQAAGNPFFVQEVLRVLVDDGTIEVRDGVVVGCRDVEGSTIPGSVQEVVMARFDHRSAEEKKVLQVGSVLGATFQIALLEKALSSLLDLDTHLAALERSGFLTSVDRRQGPELGFAHPIMQEVVYDTMLEAQRRSLHEDVGVALEAFATPATPSILSMLAYHFGRARNPEKTERYLLLAGEEASRSAAAPEALDFFREASKVYMASAGESVDPRRRALLARNLGMALFHRGELVESAASFTDALTHLGVPPVRSLWMRRLRLVRNVLGVLSLDAFSRGQERRREASAQESEIVDLFYRRGTVQSTRDPEGLVFDSLEGMFRLARLDPASVPKSEEMYAGGTNIFSFGGLSFAIGERFLAMSERARARRGVDDSIYCGLARFVHHYLRGDWKKEHEIDPIVLERQIQGGELFEVTNYLGLLVEKSIWQGHFDEAREGIERIARIWERFRHKDAKTNGFALPAFLAVERRELDAGLAAARAYHAENPDDLIRILALSTSALALTLQGELEPAAKDLDEAEVLFDRNQPIMPFYGSAYARSRLQHDVAALRAAARPDRAGFRKARRHARAAARFAAKASFRRPEVARLRGELAWLDGRKAEARRHWERGLEEAARLGTRPEEGRLHACLAALDLEARGAHREAAERIFADLDLRFDAAALDAGATV